MALTGYLSDLSAADLIQLHCQSASQARLAVNSNGRQVEVYFSNGEVVHAQGEGLQGEEAAYALLAWDEGAFEVQQGTPPPALTIHMPWSALILEGLRRKDEMGDVLQAAPPPDPLHQALQAAAAETSFQGMVLVSRDGVVLAAVLPGGFDVTRTGAIAAGLLSLSGRSVGQLGRGDLLQTLIQGSNGNLIITQSGTTAALLALAPADLNLGMAFLEARESAEALAQALAGK